MSTQIKSNRQIAQEAAEWAEQVDDGSLAASERSVFAEWLMRSPEHVNEFLLAMTIFTAWDETLRNQDIPVAELLAKAAPEVVPILDQQPAAKQALSVFKRAKPSLVAAAIVTIGIVLGAAFFTGIGGSGNKDIAQLYTTIVGEQRSIPLADGSVMHLNTQSQVHVRFTDHKREIHLLDGEALFQVARDPQRPFRVHTDFAVAEAVGTQFNVYHLDSRTAIAVIEGMVAVAAAIPPNNGTDRAQGPEQAPLQNPRIMLAAGKQTIVNQTGALEAAPIANLKAVTAWRIRQLVFERAPLSTIVREYNRYNRTRIIIDDPELVNMRISGVFMADDPESLLSSLELSGDVQVERSRPGEIRLKGN